MAEAARAARLLASAVATLALAGCANEAKKREAELTQVLDWLPGSYDNAAQANSDPQNGVRPPHAHVALLIVKVYTPRLGHHVLFAQESAGDDPLRVMSERLFGFAVDERRGILATVYTFAEPLRWRDGQEHAEVFTSVVVDDVRGVPGCELVWKKDGASFTAAPDAKLCHDSSAAAARAELTGDSLELAGYRFRKRG
jgi:hypothetical protein